MNKCELKLIVNNDDKPSGLLDIDEKVMPRLKPDWMGPDGGDWLSQLAMHPGTQFLAKDKVQGRRWQILEFTAIGKMQGNVCLCPVPHIQDPRSWFWVDPVIFCEEWEYRGVTEIPGETTEDTTE